MGGCRVSVLVVPLASLDAYLARIGLASAPRPGLARVHRAHVTSIPFENFDPYGGRPVTLDTAHLEDKLVTRGRGGYCFEHNTLLRGALESLGLEVEPMLARVRLGPEGSPRPLNHLLLRVTDRRGTWLADVGFGAGAPLDPLPFELDTETEQSGWRYRLVTDAPEWVLQTHNDGSWSDMYGFVPEPVEDIDIEVQNWFTSTHPSSSFVTGLLTGRRQTARCVSLFVFEQGLLIERPVGGASAMTEVPRADVPRLMAEQLGIEGVTLGDDGRFALAESASA